MVCFRKIAGASVAFAKIVSAMPSEMVEGEVAVIDSERVNVQLPLAEVAQVAEVQEDQPEQQEEAKEEEPSTEDASNEEAEEEETSAEASDLEPKKVLHTSETIKVPELEFSEDLPFSSISTDMVAYKKLKNYYSTYYAAQKACKKFHPSAKLAEARSLAEWEALQIANNDDTNRIGPKKTGCWISNGMIMNNGHGNQRMWASGLSISSMVSQEQARSNIPCAVLNIKNGYSVVNCGTEKKNTGAICEIRSNVASMNYNATVPEGFSVPLSGCKAWAAQAEQDGENGFIQVQGQDESSECVFYKATEGISSNYYHASQACKLIHPDSEPAEARNINEFQAMLDARSPDSKNRYWLGRGPENVKPKAGRTWKSGFEVNLEFFKTVSLIMNTDFTEYACMKLGQSVKGKEHDYVEPTACDTNDSSMMTMCELRI